jgi:hypothetical protein
MKHSILLILFSVTTFTVFSQSPEHIFMPVSDFFPEKSISENRALNKNIRDTHFFTAVARYLSRAGWDTRVRDFSELQDGHSFSRVLEAVLPGTGADELVVVVPVDTGRILELYADSDTPRSFVQDILEGAANLTEQPLPVSLRLVFAGDEHASGVSAEKGLGSRLFLQNYFPEGVAAVLYFDVLEVPETFRINPGGNGVVSPVWLVRRVIDALNASEFSYEIEANRLQVYRTGLADTAGPADPYMQREYPAITLSESGSSSISRSSQPRPERNASWTIIQNVMELSREGFPRDWDRNYLLFHVHNRLLFLGERQYLTLFMAVICITLVYGFLHRDRVARYTQTIIKNVWNLPVLFAVLYVFLLASTAILRLILELRNYPEFWQTLPLSFFTLKISLTVFFFLVSLHFIFRLPFSKNGSFYSASALVLLFIGMMAIGAIRISYSAYFLWAYLWAFLFSTARSIRVMVLSLLAAPIWLFWAASEILIIPELNTTRILLLSSVQGNLVLALVILPFLLMIIRLDFLIRHPRPGGTRFGIMLLTITFGGISLLFFLFLVQVNLFRGNTLQPVVISESRPADADAIRLSVTSPAPIPETVLYRGDNVYRLEENRRRFRTEFLAPNPPVVASVSRTSFLDRSRIEVEFLVAEPMDSLEIRLFSPEQILILDSDFPYRVELNGQSADFFIGSQPPNPLSLEFTVPDTLSFTLEYTAGWSTLTYPVRLSPGQYDISTYRAWTGRLQFDGTD